jgi:L-2,4-diaminobutyric acid acetyltransferase
MLSDDDNNAGAPSADTEDGITFRKPESEDGARVHELIAECKPLDENSLYCNLLQCTHFADTSVAAELDGDLVGFISGYIPPKQQNTLFVWQVAVHQRARGKGLAKRMLSELIGRPETEQVQFIDTTITPDNEASWGMFRSFAYQRRMPTEEFILFDSRLHFSGQHKDEHLLRIGPFNLNDA